LVCYINSAITRLPQAIVAVHSVIIKRSITRLSSAHLEHMCYNKISFDNTYKICYNKEGSSSRYIKKELLFYFLFHVFR
jgi:hypothetical protein